MTTPVGGDRPFFQQGTNVPEVIAHRGGAGEWPQETLFAFERALKAGVDVIELDVRQTKDGEIVLMHNASVDDTTDGEGRVEDLTLAEIKQLDAAAKWSPKEDFQGITVPTLKEVFEAFPNARMNIEIKQKESSLVEKFCDLIGKHNMTDKVLVASGWNSVLHEFRKRCPDVATSASVLQIAEFQALSKVLDWDYRPDTDALQWHSEFLVPIITKDFVDKARELNLKVHAWTVNKPEEMQRMIELGVDGIITDHPTTLLKLLGRPSTAPTLPAQPSAPGSPA